MDIEVGFAPYIFRFTRQTNFGRGWELTILFINIEVST